MIHADFSQPDLPLRTAVEPDPCTRLATRQNAFLMYLRRHIGNPDAAQDVLQDFNLKVIRAAGRAVPVRNTDAWLARVLRNTLFDHYRRNDTRRRAEAAYAGYVEVLAGSNEDEIYMAEAAGEGFAAIEMALASIRADHAELIRKLYLRGLPRDTLATEMGLEVGTLNVRALRARRALREEIERQAERPPTAVAQVLGRGTGKRSIGGLP